MQDAGIAIGALLLFLTNLSAIVSASSMVFLFFGFRPNPGKRFRVFSRGMAGTLLLLLVVSVTLTVLTVQSIRETLIDRGIEKALAAELTAMDGIEIDRWEAEQDAEGWLSLQVHVHAVRTFSHQDVLDLQERISAHLHRPVLLTLFVSSVEQFDTT